MKSVRRVALPDEARDFLKRLRRSAKDPDGLIFRRADGSMIDPDYFDEWLFAPVAKKAGLKGVRFHDLRHFFASMLIAQGETAKYVCDQMGHSSIQVTFDTYGHLFPQSRREAAAKLQAAMSRGKDKANSSGLVAVHNISSRKRLKKEDEDE